MKKLGLLFTIVLVTLCSCKKNDLTYQLPQLKGSWIWAETSVGGPAGVITADSEKNLVITFDDKNRISIEYDGETIVSEEAYTWTKSDNKTYGDYMIALPEGVREKVQGDLDMAEGSVVIDGYIRHSVYGNSAWGVESLLITEKEGKDLGIVGGDDFHSYSAFVPNTFVMQ